MCLLVGYICVFNQYSQVHSMYINLHYVSSLDSVTARAPYTLQRLGVLGQEAIQDVSQDGSVFVMQDILAGLVHQVFLSGFGTCLI